MTGARGVGEHGKLITGDELARMPDHELCELIDGRIVPMSPTNPEHGRIEANVVAALLSRVCKSGNRDDRRDRSFYQVES